MRKRPILPIARLLTVGLVLTGVLGLSSGAGAAKDNVFSGRWLSSTAMQLAMPPEGREGYCLGSEGNKIYVTHGFSNVAGDSADVRIYDTAADAWSAGTSSPNPRSEGVGVSHAGLIYCLGGRPVFAVGALNEAYDPVTDSWTTLSPMLTARAGLVAAVVGNKIYTVGGNLSGSGPCTGPALNVAEVYDIASDTWNPFAPPPIPVTQATAVAHGGKVYVIGGCMNVSQPVVPGPVQIYNVASGNWTMGAPMPTPRAALALGLLGNTIYAIGGWTPSSGNLNVVEAYDVDKDAWTTGITPKTTAASENFGETHGNTVYVPGSGSFGAAFNLLEAFRRK